MGKSVWAAITLAVVLAVSGGTAGAQIQATQAAGQNVFGVFVDAAGVLKFDEKLANAEQLRLKPRRTNAAQHEELHFVSLPKLFAQVRPLINAGRELPPEARYLGGLTQIRYVLVFPSEKDLVIAGPAEAWDASNVLQPRGKLSGRPIVQLDDLIVAMRMANEGRPFGCSIDPPEHSVQKGEAVLKEYGNGSRRELAAALARELGDQQIRFFGTPADSRLAFVCVAADYQLKRYTIGLDSVPVAGIGNAIDNSRVAGNGFWFEACYEPILVAPDHNAFELRGQRLLLKAGAIPFDDRGATDKAKAFAKRFTEKMSALAAAVPLIADLQNAADVAVVACLIRQEKLDQRVEWDTSWIMDSSKLPAGKVPVAQVTATIVNFTNGSLAAGGVELRAREVAERQEIDRKGELEAVRHSFNPPAAR